MALEEVDVLIVGAGLSGIGAACRLTQLRPGSTFAILEARDTIGGTWDLFRYPGVRSDSDMHTLGYPFRPWVRPESIASGPAIRDYIRDAAQEYGVDRAVRFGHRVVRADWSSDEARWTVEAQRTDTGETVRIRCRFLLACSGYYRYDEGYTPDFPGRDRFRGRIVHPQHWPDDLDHTGKRIAVIGSGATAVTLVPALAETAGHVTMLQRSPGYIVSLPSQDPFAAKLRRRFPAPVAHRLARARSVVLGTLMYQLSRRAPGFTKRLLRKGVTALLPADYDVDTHFAPSYDPWDQRLCLVPDGDLFAAIRSGRAEIVTDRIATFTETGIRLESGRELLADVIVTATGLVLQALGGATLTVDGQAVEVGRRVSYKGVMLSGVPNLALVLGYTNASWTLKSDLISRYVCRLLDFMDAHGHAVAVPEAPPADELEPLIGLRSGYVLRGADAIPRQGTADPWRAHQNYPRDVLLLTRGRVGDGLRFSPAPALAGAVRVA